MSNESNEFAIIMRVTHLIYPHHPTPCTAVDQREPWKILLSFGLQEILTLEGRIEVITRVV